MIPHLPVLRHGRPYESLDVRSLVDPRTGLPLAKLGLANDGLIRRDAANWPTPPALDAPALAAVFRAAAQGFQHATLTLSPDEYVARLSSTTGLTPRHGRAQMDRIAKALTTLGDNLPPVPAEHAAPLAVILPSNAPAVNTVWLAALALRRPVALKPGARDPWTPWRLLSALLDAGHPKEALGFYPTDHAGSAALMEAFSSTLLFGDESVAARYAEDPRVQVRGPGRSKILLANQACRAWQDHLDTIAASVADLAGRSCLNASTVVLTDADAPPQDIAQALAERLLALEADQLAASVDPGRTEALDRWIAERLQVPGARDVSQALRENPSRVQLRGGLPVLLPTVILCDDIAHPLAQTELPFPFVSVVSIPSRDVAGSLGPTLALSVLGADDGLLADLRATGCVQRLITDGTATTQASDVLVHLQSL